MKLMKNKKIIILITINIVILIFLYFLFKFISLLMFLKVEYSGFDLIKTASSIMIQKSYEDFYKYNYYRPTEYPDSKEKPILILGCSFAQGLSVKMLNEDETISHLLAKELKVKRPVINRALGSSGIQAMIWQFTSGEIDKVVKKEPELIVYVLINDIMRRLYMESCPWNKSALYKEKKDGSLTLIKNPFYYTYIAALIRDKYFEGPIYYGKLTDKENFTFLRKHFLYLKKEVDKKWKDTKFLILYYHDEQINEYIKTLENDGFDVILLKDITPEGFIQDLKYRVSENDKHPTKEAWEVVTPNLYTEISKRYNIE